MTDEPHFSTGDVPSGDANPLTFDDLARMQRLLEGFDLKNIESMLQDVLIERALRQSGIDTWPEIFGEMSKDELDKLTLADVRAKINHNLLHGDGANAYRGMTRLRSCEEWGRCTKLAMLRRGKREWRRRKV